MIQQSVLTEKRQRTHLTDAEVAQFRTDGFLIAPFRFDEQDVAALRTDLWRIMEMHPDLRNRPMTTAHFRHRGAKGEFSLMPFCERPEILDMIESIDGPDLILWTTTVFDRPATDGVATPWHQDGDFWPIEPLAGTSAWVAATPCTRENGCVRIIPGSHRRPLPHVRLDDGVFGKTTDPNTFDEADAIDVVLQPGEMMLFNSGLIHGSWPNTGGQRRTGFVMRYIPSTSFFNHDGNARPDGSIPYADRALFLVRGIDRCGRNDFRRNH